MLNVMLNVLRRAIIIGKFYISEMLYFVGIKVHLLHPYLNECNTEFSLYSTAKRHYIPDHDQIISSQTQTKPRTLGRKRSSNTIDPSDVRRGSTIVSH
jgi:hypothetical protein